MDDRGWIRRCEGHLAEHESEWKATPYEPVFSMYTHMLRVMRHVQTVYVKWRPQTPDPVERDAYDMVWKIRHRLERDIVNTYSLYSPNNPIASGDPTEIADFADPVDTRNLSATVLLERRRPENGNASVGERLFWSLAAYILYLIRANAKLIEAVRDHVSGLARSGIQRHASESDTGTATTDTLNLAEHEFAPTTPALEDTKSREEGPLDSAVRRACEMVELLTDVNHNLCDTSLTGGALEIARLRGLVAAMYVYRDAMDMLHTYRIESAYTTHRVSSGILDVGGIRVKSKHKAHEDNDNTSLSKAVRAFPARYAAGRMKLLQQLSERHACGKSVSIDATRAMEQAAVFVETMQDIMDSKARSGNKKPKLSPSLVELISASISVLTRASAYAR